MKLQEDLLNKEKSLWSGGEPEYRGALDKDCLVAFAQMAGVQTREQIAGMVGKSQRWHDLDLDVEGFLQPVDDIAILTYRISALRGDADEPYTARVSSGYVNRDGDWRMMFHQQTPLEADAGGRKNGQ